MPTRFLNRSDAMHYARKQGWKTFRTVYDAKDDVWKAGYEQGISPAEEWAQGKDFVAWTETTWDEGVKRGVLIVSCTEEELADENIPEDFVVEPQTPELWAHEKPKRGGSTSTKTPHGERERSTVVNPTRLVWRIADEMVGKERKEIIARCIAEGIHPSTASTQYAKWRKERLATK